MGTIRIFKIKMATLMEILCLINCNHEKHFFFKLSDGKTLVYPLNNISLNYAEYHVVLFRRCTRSVRMCFYLVE